MGPLRLTVIFITLHLVVSSPTCPAAAEAEQPSQGRALLQRSHSVRKTLKVDANSSDEGLVGAVCPWSATTNVDFQLQCVDGTLCSSWSCCRDHGGRGKCPPNRPLMCADKRCSKGTEHCCKTSCSRYGGLRPCPSGGVCPYRGTTEENDKMECADKTLCTGSGCCAAHGGVTMCPLNSPLMCNAKTCGGDHCCKTDCAVDGGIRSCAEQVLMIGNSYTHYNIGVDTVLRAFFSEVGKPRRIVRLTRGGEDLEYHLNQANTEGTPHYAEFSGGQTPGGYVVVQEQSYVPGTVAVVNTENTFNSSKHNLFLLDSKIAALDATTVLYQTWGWRDGHRTRPYLSTFPKFNAEVAKGYQEYKKEITRGERTPLLAPVGNAFKNLHDQGTSAGSLYYKLYNEDAQHPSDLGTYLAGCVIYSTITGLSSLGLPALGITEAEASALQAEADAVVFP